MKKRNWMPMLALAAPMLLWAQPDTAYGEPGVPRLTNLPPQRVLAIEAGKTILLGVLPMLLLAWMDPSVTGLVNQLARLGR